MKCKTMLAVIACLSVSLSAGCSKKASTPKEALDSMFQALRDGDTKAFVACLDATEDHKKILIAMFERTSATTKFEEATVKEYGEGAVKKSGAKSNSDDVEYEKWLENVEFKIDGDKATATIKGDEEPLKFVKKDGGWKIVVEDLNNGNQMKDLVDRALEVFEAMTEATKDATGKIGKDGYTAEKINKELDAEIFKARTAGAAAP